MGGWGYFRIKGQSVKGTGAISTLVTERCRSRFLAVVDKGTKGYRDTGKIFSSSLRLNWRYEDLTKCTGTIVTTYDLRLSNKEKKYEEE